MKQLNSNLLEYYFYYCYLKFYNHNRQVRHRQK
nr:MAG TPA: hypothetical protein [Caudoviricetes sp.]